MFSLSLTLKCVCVLAGGLLAGLSLSKYSRLFFEPMFPLRSGLRLLPFVCSFVFVCCLSLRKLFSCVFLRSVVLVFLPALPFSLSFPAICSSFLPSGTRGGCGSRPAHMRVCSLLAACGK